MCLRCICCGDVVCECCSIVVLFVCVLVIVFCLVGLFLTSCARVSCVC